MAIITIAEREPRGRDTGHGEDTGAGAERRRSRLGDPGEDTATSGTGGDGQERVGPAR